MDPINNNNVFSIDYHRYVTQDLLKEMPPQNVESQPKKFNLKETSKSEKSKKEQEDQKKKKKPFTMD